MLAASAALPALVIVAAAASLTAEPPSLVKLSVVALAAYEAPRRGRPISARHWAHPRAVAIEIRSGDQYTYLNPPLPP